jgi:hypothetical protein
MFHVRRITFYSPRESSELLQDLVANLSVTTIFIGWNRMVAVLDFLMGYDSYLHIGLK